MKKRGFGAWPVRAATDRPGNTVMILIIVR